MDRKILIVDDEADIRDILQFNLENAGFDVECAASAEEALKVLSDSHSLILLDVIATGIVFLISLSIILSVQKCERFVYVNFVSCSFTELIDELR